MIILLWRILKTQILYNLKRNKKNLNANVAQNANDYNQQTTSKTKG